MHRSILTLVPATLVCFFFYCNDKNPNGQGPGVIDDLIGTWEEYIPASPPFIPEPLTIGMSLVETDSLFHIYVIEDSVKEMFNHTGGWEIIGDSIYLRGDFCEILDTTADPDTLAPLPDSICTQTIVLDTARTLKNIWVIEMGNLGPLIESFPLDPFYIGVIKQIDLFMEKQ